MRRVFYGLIYFDCLFNAMVFNLTLYLEKVRATNTDWQIYLASIRFGKVSFGMKTTNNGTYEYSLLWYFKTLNSKRTSCFVYVDDNSRWLFVLIKPNSDLFDSINILSPYLLDKHSLQNNKPFSGCFVRYHVASPCNGISHRS